MEDSVSQSTAHPRHSLWEWSVPAAAGLTLIVTCILASSRILLWHDERYTDLLVAHGDWAQMMRGIHAGIDGSPPMYMLALRAWGSLAGTSPLSLRLFSALAMTVGFTAMWLLGRRLAGFWAASLGCVAVFFNNPFVFTLNAECRHYALVIALLSLLLLQFERTTRPGRPSWSALLAYALTTGLLVLTHLFGFIFSGLLLLAMVLADLPRRTFRPWHFAAGAAGWLFFLPWLPYFLDQAKIGKPWFWIIMPEWSVLTKIPTYTHGAPKRFILVVLAGMILSVALRGRKASWEELRSKWFSPTNAPITLGAFLLVTGVPLATWIVSLVVQPMWLDRYQFPAVLGWSILVPLLLASIGRLHRERVSAKVPLRLVRPAVMIAFTLFIAANLVRFGLRIEKLPTEPLPGQMAALSLPLAVRNTHAFTYLNKYEPQIDVWYVLDWEGALRSPMKGMVSGHNIMAAVKQNFPEMKIIQSEEFLRRFKSFYFLEQGDSVWPPRTDSGSGYLVAPDGPTLLLPRPNRRFEANSLYRVEQR